MTALNVLCVGSTNSFCMMKLKLRYHLILLLFCSFISCILLTYTYMSVVLVVVTATMRPELQGYDFIRSDLYYINLKV